MARFGHLDRFRLPSPARHGRNRGLRKAAVLPLVTALFTVLVVMTAFAVDVGNIAVTRAELRAAVDAANLAGASGLNYGPAEARKRAREIAAQNLVGGRPLVIQDSDIDLGNWDPATKAFIQVNGAAENTATAIRVTGQLSQARGTAVNYFFARIIGFQSKDLTQSAVAGTSPAPDMVIVQDITASFSAEIADAKVGDQAVLTSLYNGGTGLAQLGIAVHTGWGRTLAQIQPVRTNYTALTNVVSSIKLCGNTGMPVCSGTDIAAGLEEGIRMFGDAAYVPRNGAAKVLLLVSDGEPNSSSAGSHPGLTNSQMLTLAQTRADEAWSRGIHVYIVFYNRDGDASAAAKVATLPRGKGDFVQVINANDLPAALEAVLKRLPVGLLK